MKRTLNIATLILSIGALMASCKETAEFDEFGNWQEVNEEYIDDIVLKCTPFIEKGITVDNASKGDMFRLLSYQKDPESDKHGRNAYVYCEVIAEGEGSVSPNFTDSVWIDYRSRLVPTVNYPDGKIMDQSYRTADVDRNQNIPYPFVTSKLVIGVSTALMHMVPGDVWRLYIPYELAYGKKDYNGVPGYSTLIFDICLERFKPTMVE